MQLRNTGRAKCKVCPTRLPILPAHYVPAALQYYDIICPVSENKLPVYCVGWGVKLYTHPNPMTQILEAVEIFTANSLD